MMGGDLGMGMAGTGGSAAAFQMALQSSMLGQAGSKLLLLLPVDLLQQALVPHGHLSDIAQRCQICIDLGPEVHPNMRQVSLSGSVTANAVAVYLLQERAAQCGVRP